MNAYIRIERNKFGIITDDVYKIEKEDISITQNEYEEYKNLHEQGVEFKLKENRNGASFYDILEIVE